MIVDSESPLAKIPLNLNLRQKLLIEAIRYSSSMATISYARLQHDLHQISLGNRTQNDFYIIFNGAWSVIDAVNRLYNVFRLMKPLGSDFEKCYESVKAIRNGFHHMDERIKNKHQVDRYFLFGVLSWVFGCKVQNKVVSFIAMPGCLYPEMNADCPNPLGKLVKGPIDQIVISAAQRAIGQPAVSINLCETMEVIELEMRDFERLLSKEFEKDLFKETLPSDLLFDCEFLF